MSNRQVGTFRSGKARGASVKMPDLDNQGRYALVGRVMVTVLGLGLTVLAGYGVVQAYHKVNAQKIETVQIEGTLKYVSGEDIKEAVNRFAMASLVTIDLDLLKAELETQPWISQVNVRREWPDRLVIQVEEEQPIARWNESHLLNQQGQIFSPESAMDELQLPRLTGPGQSEQTVMLQYLQFNQLLYPLGVRIRNLELNDRSAWTMTLTNGAEVRLGRDHVLDRLRRLVVFLESDYGKEAVNIGSIDLRYRNGIAVAPRADVTADTETDEVVAL
jgi:cell division protein FtsQ